MRTVAVLIGVVAAVSVGMTSLSGASAASHTNARAVVGADSPSWSPDGKQIAFAYLRYVSQKNCCGSPPSLVPTQYRIVRTSSRPGRAVHTVLAAKSWCCWQLQWAAGGRILANLNGGRKGLESVSAQGGKTRQLVLPGCQDCGPSGFLLSPNREYAAVATSDSDPHVAWGIALVRLRPGRTPAVVMGPLATEEAQHPYFDVILAFSPDGKQLVFSRYSWDGWNGGPSALMAIRLDGGGSVPLAQSGIPGAGLVPNDAQQLQWSADGRWVAYVEGDSQSNQTLEVVPTAGGTTPRVLATCGAQSVLRFAWSPTSKSIAYNCTTGGNWTGGQFMTVSPEGTHLTNLLKGHSLTFVWHFSVPQWSPDGSRLLFLAQGVGHRTAHVWTVRPDGRDLTRIG
jgi:Tol biopolymer transport system component